MAGKTGTAQKIIDGHYSDSANIASFVGFLPAEQPAIAMIVVLDEPQPLHTGGLVAASVEYEYVRRDVRRIIRVGGSLIGLLAILFVLIDVLGVIEL